MGKESATTNSLVIIANIISAVLTYVEVVISILNEVTDNDRSRKR